MSNENQRHLIIQTLDERVRGNHAWNTCEGGVRGMYETLDQVRKEYEKEIWKKTSKWWVSGVSVIGLISVFVVGWLYFNPPERLSTTIKIENPKREEIIAETPFNVVDTYHGVSEDRYPDKDLEKELNKLWQNFCTEGYVDYDRLVCIIKKCVQYEKKEKRTYKKETNEMVVELDDGLCIRGESTNVIPPHKTEKDWQGKRIEREYGSSDIKDVIVEFNEKHIPRIVIKVEKDQPIVVMDDKERELFESTITKLKSKGELERVLDNTGFFIKESESYSEPLWFINSYLSSLIFRLEAQLDFDPDEMDIPPLLEKADIKFRYVEYLPDGFFEGLKTDFFEDEKYDSMTNEKRNKEYNRLYSSTRELLSIEIYVKGFSRRREKDVERMISIPASELTYSDGPAFLLKIIANAKERDPYNKGYDEDLLKTEDVYPLTYTFPPKDIRKHPTRIVSRTFVTIEANTEKIVIGPNPSLTVEENTLLMKQLADVFRTQIESLFFASKQGYLCGAGIYNNDIKYCF